MEDLRAGILAATIARSAGAKDVGPGDFMLRPPEEAEAEDPVAQLKRVLGEG